MGFLYCIIYDWINQFQHQLLIIIINFINPVSHYLRLHALCACAIVHAQIILIRVIISDGLPARDTSVCYTSGITLSLLGSSADGFSTSATDLKC